MDDTQGQFMMVIGQQQTKMLTTQGLITQEEFPVIRRGLTFAFKVRVENENGWSEFSDITYIQTAEVPNRPAPPELVAASQTVMTLKFFKPENNGGSPVTQYELFINDGDPYSEPMTKVESYSDNQMEHTLYDSVDSLTTGLIYKFKFRATNAIGNSEDSEIVEFALVDQPVATSAPTCIYSQTSTTQIAIKWNAI